MVKLFLCCGCKPEGKIKNVLEDNIVEAFSTFLDKSAPIKKQLRHYFKVAECFQDFVQCCAKSNSFMLFSLSNKKEKNPEKALLNTAKLDKAFFNELVLSLLKDGDEWMLNKQLNHFDDKKRFYTCLLNFANQNNAYLTADTLEKIGDDLIGYRKSRAFTRCENDAEALKMASEFYQLAIAASNDNYDRVLQKLQEMGTHENLTLDYLCKK